ncbi:MAG: hypothetical protein AABW84_00140, partial [Nanoarchaeota archaeon]
DTCIKSDEDVLKAIHSTYLCAGKNHQDIFEYDTDKLETLIAAIQQRTDLRWKSVSLAKEMISKLSDHPDYFRPRF